MIVLGRYQIAGGNAAAISASVEDGVRTGALAAGAALPPVRMLAQTLGVSPATVAKAYQELRSRGVLETAGRNGTRVRHRPAVLAPRASLRLPPPPGTVDLSTGDPDRRLLPPLGPHLTAIADHYREAMTYADAGTLPAFLSTARDRLAADGIDAPEVMVTGGALDGVDRLLATHLRPGDAVAVEDPGWANLLDLVAAHGLRPIAVPVDDAGPTTEGLATALTLGARAVVVTSRAQNPTGAVIDASRAVELRAVLGAHPDVLLIEDDHAAELAAVELCPLAGATPHWAFLRSASKPWGPDLRIAILGGDAGTLARVAGRIRIGSGWVSTVAQRLLLLLWQHEAGTVAAAGADYDRRRRALVDAISVRGGTAHGRTGINVWVRVHDETRAVGVLRDAGYAVSPGILYRIGSPQAIRISIGSLDPAAIEPLADVILAAAGPGRGTGFAY